MHLQIIQRAEEILSSKGLKGELSEQAKCVIQAIMESLAEKPIEPPKKEPQIATDILADWNSNPCFPKCLALSGTRKRALEARLREPFFRVNWKEALRKSRQSSFCCGTNDRNWKANFDWFVRPDTVVKIMEGQYDDKKGGNSNIPKCF